VLVGDATPLPDGGNFIAPTLFDQVDPGATLARDEVFGPVLALLPADDLAGAISLANAVEYGHSASIFTRDIGRAFAFIREIEAGIVHVNSETAGAEPHVPFGGMKGSSSYSREQGKAAVEFFTQTKTVYLDMPPE
jgi:aldehyde dehydrogenase (NAD+)